MMKSLATGALALSCIATVQAADDAAPAPTGAAPQAALSASGARVSANDAARKSKMKPELAGFCLYGKLPSGDAKYTLLRATKTSRETYGGVTDELPRFVDTAKANGGDAVVNFNGAQHFGFWPWRLVRPVLSGTPIKWDGPAPDCAASGGKTFAQVMDTNEEPPKK